MYEQKLHLLNKIASIQRSGSTLHLNIYIFSQVFCHFVLPWYFISSFLFSQTCYLFSEPVPSKPPMGKENRTHYFWQGALGPFTTALIPPWLYWQSLPWIPQGLAFTFPRPRCKGSSQPLSPNQDASAQHFWLLNFSSFLWLILKATLLFLSNLLILLIFQDNK